MKTIPKKIHYCWFGRNEKPLIVQKCIETWRYVLSEYELLEWNEDNFNCHSNAYAREAYEKRKWAFVSDYARLVILKQYGGIYLDTDVEVLRNFNQFLHHPAFMGLESDYKLGSAVIGSVAENPLITLLLQSYEERHFIKHGFKMDLTPNTDNFTSICEEQFGFNPNNTLQNLGDIVIYPRDYFYAKNNATGKIHQSNNTVSIHHFDASWVGTPHKLKHASFKTFHKMFGPEAASKALALYKKICFNSKNKR